MRIVINNVNYNKIKNINFVPETDVIGGELPINEFTAEIYTDNEIEIGQYAYLYGKDGKLWAKYWIVECAKYSEDTYTINCQSDLLLLDRKTLTPTMYTNDNAKELLEIIFGYCNLNVEVDNSLNSETITGFCPEQSAKERIQWICFVIGAYVQSFFTNNIKIMPIDTTANFISPEITYYAPSVSYSDYVTAVEVVAYTFTQGTPTAVDEWVQDSTNYYIKTYRTAVLRNSAVSNIVPDNIVKVDDVTIINENNVDNILARISEYYFKRVEISAEIVDNGEYLAGKRYYIDTGLGTIADGFIKSLNFTFGNNHKSQITMKQANEQESIELVVIYTFHNNEIERHIYNMPSGYAFEFQNPYLDIMFGDMRRIYYPLSDTLTGVVGTETTTVSQAYEVALQYQDWELEINSVDTISQDEESGEVTIS